MTEVKGPIKSSLLGSSYDVVEFDIGDCSRTTAGPASKTKASGGYREIKHLYPSLVARFRGQVGAEYVPVPYTFLDTDSGRVVGDYTGEGGKADFFAILSKNIAGPYVPHDDVRELWKLVVLLRNLSFKKNDAILAARGLSLKGGIPEFELGMSYYSDAAHSVNSDGTTVELSEERKHFLKRTLTCEEFEELVSLVAKFEKNYGSGLTVREIIARKYGGLPKLGEAYTHIMGTASVVLTEDGYVVLGMRSPKTTLVNHGPNVPTSGGIDYDENGLRKLGLPRYLIKEAFREAHEELGITGDRMRVRPLAFIRELTRGGLPDILSLIEYRGSLSELVQTIAKNPHPGRKEIDRTVFALRLSDARRLVLDPQAASAVHHKALVTLIMLDRHFKGRRE